MSKKPPKPIAPIRPLSRRAPTKTPLPVFYIFSEGSVTEPEYIYAYFRDKCKQRKAVLSPIIGGAGVPMTLVEKCVAKKAELRKAAKSDSFEKNSFVWAVFDVDIHPRLEEAIDMAIQSGIRCIISNPCIEVWGLMHYSIYERPLTRHEAQSELAKYMPGYHHDNSPSFPWGLCVGKVEAAIGQAKKALKRRELDGNPFPKGNPTTNFYELLDALSGVEPEEGTKKANPARQR